MSIFKIPLSICRAIEQRIAAFWWRNGESKTGIHWRRWELLKTRKDKGGLGIRDLTTFNKAMLGEQARRFSQFPSAPWSRVLKGLYFPHTDFWHAGKGYRSSWGWQSLIMGRDAISNSVLWSVGNGESIKIREDRWLPLGVIGGPANCDEPEYVTALINKHACSRDEQEMRRWLEDRVVKEIVSIPLPTFIEADRMVWTEPNRVNTQWKMATMSSDRQNPQHAYNNHPPPTKRRQNFGI